MRCTTLEDDPTEECFEGFAYDLVKRMAKDNGFKFKFTTNQDYGTLNQKSGKWSGMIGELQSTVSIYIYNLLIVIHIIYNTQVQDFEVSIHIPTKRVVRISKSI